MIPTNITWVFFFINTLKVVQPKSINQKNRHSDSSIKIVLNQAKRLANQANIFQIFCKTNEFHSIRFNSIWYKLASKCFVWRAIILRHLDYYVSLLKNAFISSMFDSWFKCVIKLINHINIEFMRTGKTMKLSKSQVVWTIHIEFVRTVWSVWVLHTFECVTPCKMFSFSFLSTQFLPKIIQIMWC